VGRRVTIRVLDESFTFEVQGDAKRAQEVAEYVERQVRDADRALRGAAGVSGTAVLSLAALRMASDYLGVKAAHRAFKEKVIGHQQRLSGSLDKMDLEDGP
jgi:cell division protein ZapA (FtsZ GTPase activity inhibitor)